MRCSKHFTMSSSKMITIRYSCLLLAATMLLQCNFIKNCNGLSQQSSKTYNYFAYGSNMASSTMINLRELSPLASAAAVLPAHVLRFNIPGVPLVEPSSASVEPVDNIMEKKGMDDVETIIESGQLVHGVLYKLSEDDFARVCSTEGVPFAYSLHRCRCIPYAGDGKRAGEDCLRRVMRELDEINMIPAFTLRAAREKWRRDDDIAPSQSYLNVLIQGAKEFRLDETYLQKLQQIEAGRTFGPGMAEELLRRAENRRR